MGLNDDDFDFAAFERMLTKAANSNTSMTLLYLSRNILIYNNRGNQRRPRAQDIPRRSGVRFLTRFLNCFIKYLRMLVI